LDTTIRHTSFNSTSFAPSFPHILWVMDETRNSYDRFAAAYTQRYFETRGLDAEMDRFLAWLPPAPVILDAGCGPGHLMRYLAKDQAVCVGVDYSLSMLEEGRRRDPLLRLAAGDLLSLPFLPDSFDGVWARASLIHLDLASHREALLQLHRVMKPQGILYAAVRQGYGEERRREVQQGVPIERYFRFWQPEEWHAEIRSAGFDILEQATRRTGSGSMLGGEQAFLSA
jgi:SAM-dependent methyltransferase